jgi:anti-anti-sigma factor
VLPGYVGVVEALRFKLTVATICEGTYVLTLGGEADVANAAEVEQALVEILADGGRDVIVDLLDVPFVDSTILGVLLRYSRRLRHAGGTLVLVCDDVRVMRAFEISGLGAYFSFERSLGPAVDAAIARSVAC